MEPPSNYFWYLISLIVFVKHTKVHCFSDRLKPRKKKKLDRLKPRKKKNKMLEKMDIRRKLGAW